MKIFIKGGIIMRKCKDCQLFKNGSDSVKNCLSCSNSFSEPSDNTDGDILHCMEQKWEDRRRK